jgi:hypothetical protein
MWQGFVKRRVARRKNGARPPFKIPQTRGGKVWSRPRNERYGNSLSRMDQLFLSTICAGVLLLVTAFALATPSMKPDVPPEKTVLLRIASR